MLVFNNYQRRYRQLNRKGKCHKCCKPLSNNGKTRCKECLDKHAAHERAVLSTEYGKWANQVRQATRLTIQGYNKQSKHITWGIKEAKEKWGPDVIYYREERKVIDHKMPLSCAKTLDSKVDYEMAEYLSSIDNLQLITIQANSLKNKTVEKKINTKAELLRRVGVHGRNLYLRLLSEFEHELDFTQK